MKLLKVMIAFSIVNLFLLIMVVTVMSSRSQQDGDVAKVSEQEPSPLPTTTATPSAPVVPSVSAIPTSLPAPSPKITKNNSCIITIDGNSYDVTQFRLQHPGGNIFVCGTDMSTTFWEQHDQKMLNKMQRYRVQ